MHDYSRQIRLEPILINLVPAMDVVLQNRGERQFTEWELNRITEMYQVFKINQPVNGIKVDNSHLTTDQTVDEIITVLKNQYSLNVF